MADLTQLEQSKNVKAEQRNTKTLVLIYPTVSTAFEASTDSTADEVRKQV